MTDHPASRVLPVGISEAAFDRTLEKIRAAIGDHAVRIEVGELHDHYPIGDPDEFAASGVISPSSTEEVQTVLRIANEAGLPLWTVSRGRNFAYGGPSPRTRGDVILDLSRMNRILEVSEAHGYALLEPGVSFRDLYDHLRESGSKLWPSVPDLEWGSVIGNALERGLGLTPYGDHGERVCGMEIVLADGDLVRTGMGAMTGSKLWQIYRPGFGPAWEGAFQQSNFGVITKMGIWLMPRPEAWAVCEVTLRNFADLAPLIDGLRPLCIDGTIQGSALVGDPLSLAAHEFERSRWYTGTGPVPEAVIDRIMDETGLGRWNAIFGLYGRSGNVANNAQVVRATFEAIPGATVNITHYDGDVNPDSVSEHHRAFGGIPGMRTLQMVDWMGTPGSHISFSPIAPPDGAEALRQATICRDHSLAHGFDFIGGYHISHRSMQLVSELIWRADDPEMTARARTAFAEMISEIGALGYGEYRTHVAFMDTLAQQFDFNDRALLRLNQRVKDALDPKGILSQGKSGIWSAGRGPRA